MSALSETALREINARIAGAYDAVPCDAAASPGLDPAEIARIAASYGAGFDHAACDVLDLGCGTGVQMERIASQTRGRVVGTDLSRAACDAAAARTAKFGARCNVICGDFLDLDPAKLGTFDLIYIVGVLYVVPPDMRRRILELVAACLKPRGVVLISYYAGTMPLIMAGLHNMLRASADPALPAAAQIQAARTQIRTMIDTLSRQPGDHRQARAILQQVHDTSDAIFFHEMLDESFCALSTAEIEAAFAPQGVHFVNWMRPVTFPRELPVADRVIAADALALSGGGYFYGVFQKS
jgi:SAM-dependent methyltransferase